MDDSLSNIPHIGPARRAALEAAGITTRSQLAQATVDQLVGVTGMPRAAAEKTLTLLQAAPPPEVPAPPPPREKAPEREAPSDLDRAVLRAQTALSDVTHVTLAKLDRQLQKFAALLDDLPRRAASLKPRQVRRLAARIDAVAERLIRFAAEEPSGEKAQKRARDLIRERRREIEELLAADGDRKRR